MSQYAAEQDYRPACKSEQPGGCTDCAMSYDCVRKQSGRPAWALPLVALVGAGLLAVIASLASAG